MNEAAKAVIKLTRKQKFAKVGIGFVVGYFASEAAEKVFDVAVVAIRKRKAV